MSAETSPEETAPYGTGPAAAAPAGGGAPAPVKRVRTHHLREMKQRGERFSMLTAYEQYAAQTFDEAGIEVLLVGDSASNNVFGNETSLPVTVDELIPLVRAVTRSTAYFRKRSDAAPFHCGSLGGKCEPMSPSASAPRMASTKACRPTSPSKWARKPRVCGTRTPQIIR